MRMEAGLGVVHLFGKPTASLDREAIGAAVEAAQAAECQVVTAAMLGHKSDFAIMALPPTGARCARCRPRCNPPGSSSSTAIVDHRGQRVREGHARTHAAGPPVPAAPARGQAAFCFYPMSKRREAHANWYATPFDERRDDDDGARHQRPDVRRQGRAAGHRLHRPRRLRVGRHAVRHPARGHQGRRLHAALRQGLGALRRVRPFFVGYLAFSTTSSDGGSAASTS